jgi:LacI family transcriptional regulator
MGDRPVDPTANAPTGNGTLIPVPAYAGIAEELRIDNWACDIATFQPANLLTNMKATAPGKTPVTTIRDVAARAGVSMSTVSHVINQTRHVSDAKREQVLLAMRDLGYRPNSLARSLRRNRSLAVGVIVPDCSNPFFAAITRGIEDSCFDLGYTVTICSTDENQEKEQIYVTSLIERQVDGVIMVVAQSKHEHATLLLESRIPTVVVDRDLPGLDVDAVLIDNYRGGYLAGEHLAAMGYRRPACIAGPYYSIPVQDRVRGYCDALRERGFDPADCVVEAGNFHFQGGRQAFEQLIAQHPDIDAVFACNDRLAVGAMRSAFERSYAIPQQLGIVGFDDIDLAAYTTPALTTLAQPTYVMGQQAVSLLLQRIETPETSIIMTRLGVRLVVRDSSNRAGADPQSLS